jgi:hypothetical protein
MATTTERDARDLGGPSPPPDDPETMLRAIDAKGAVRLPDSKPEHIKGASGFFDPDDPTYEEQVVLLRIVREEQEQFALLRRIGYWHNEQGPIVVPDRMVDFRTDLTSVPRWFTWLIPKSGLHLPAALIHDGLVCAEHEPQTYCARQPIERSMADQIFRDAMRDLDTTLVRRWLMWTAVTIASLWCCMHKWWFRCVMSAEILIILALGAAASVDLLSQKDLLPWMGHRGFWVELLYGSVFAVIVPVVLSPLWWRWWRAGIITGLGLALLFHITIAIAIISGLFQGAEAVIQGQAKRAAAGFGTAFALLGIIVGLVIWART